MYCKDCKWLESVILERPGNHTKWKARICKCESRKRHRRSRNQEYDLKEPCHKACKSGFAPKEDTHDDK